MKRHSPNPPLDQEGRQDFLKVAVMGGWDIFLLEMGGKPGMGGVGFIMGGWEIFKVSLHSWQRGANP